MKTWSLTKRNKFKTCPKQYYYHYHLTNEQSYDPTILAFKKAKNKKNYAMVQGIIVHEIISELVEQEIKTFDNAEEIMHDIINKYSCDYHEWENDFKVSIPMFIQNYFKSKTFELLQDENITVKSVEDFEYVIWNNVKIYIVIDLLLYNKSTKTFYIIDWKTGKPSSNDYEQLKMYSSHVYMDSNFNRNTYNIIGINEYLTLGDNHAVLHDLSSANIEYENHTLFLESYLEINELGTDENNFKNNVGKHCYYCPYHDLCPMFQYYKQKGEI